MNINSIRMLLLMKKEKLVKRGMTLGDPRDSVAKVRGKFRRR